MTRQEIVDYMERGYNEMMLEIANEDKYGTPDYIEDYYPYTDGSFDISEFQYANEFGIMMAREGFELRKDEYDEYLEQILEDSGSELQVTDLV